MLHKIDEKIYLVLNEAGFTYCNCLLVEDSIRAVIDSGADAASMDQTRPDNVDLLLNSHHHYDHIRGNLLFTKAEKKIHALDFASVQNDDEYNFYNSYDRWDELMPGYDFEAGRRQVAAGERIPISELSAHSSFEGGDVFDFGRTQCEVLHTPGHSAGHCAFWFPDSDFMFLGDICLTPTGPYYGEVCSSPADLMASIDRIIAMRPGRIATGHINRIVEDPVPRLQEYRRRIEIREERIYEFLKRQAADVHQLAGQHFIYKLHPTWYVVFWEKLMVEKHLERLELQGRVERSEQGEYRAI